MPRNCSRIGASVVELLAAEHRPRAWCATCWWSRSAKASAKRSGQRLQQDVGVIVVRGLEAFEVRFDAVDADREAAKPITLRIDEIGRGA